MSSPILYSEPVGLAFKEYIRSEVERLLTLDQKTKAAEKKKVAAAEKSKHAPPRKNTEKKRRHTLREEGEDETDVKVVDIEFAYDNYNLIGLLKKRGTAIRTLDWEAMNKLDKELVDLVMNTENGEPKKDSNGYELPESELDKIDEYDSMTRPVCAFITFESDDGY